MTTTGRAGAAFDAPVHARRRGAGPSVLCLHGIGSSSNAFALQLEALSADHDIVAWDAPGYAASPDPATAPGMDGYADVAASLMDGISAGPYHVVGVSFGAVIAVRLALRHPERIRSLVLADSSPGSGVTPERAEQMLRRPQELREVGAKAFAEARAPRLLSASAPGELVARVAADMAASIRLPGYAYAAEAMAATDHRPVFEQLRTPTLVVCGSEDRVTPPETSRDIAASIPGAEFVAVDGAGHLSNQERPDEFNRLVARFHAAVESSRERS